MVYGLSVFEQFAIWGVLGVAILGLLYALFLRYGAVQDLYLRWGTFR